MGSRSPQVGREAFCEGHTREAAGRYHQSARSDCSTCAGCEPAVARLARKGYPPREREARHQEYPDRHLSLGGNRRYAVGMWFRVRLRESRIVLLPSIAEE